MAKTAQYQIIINGLDISIDGVKKLNDQLATLEQRMKELGKQNVDIKIGGEVQTDDLKDVIRLEEKISKARGKNGQLLEEQKQVLKQVNAENKDLLAAQRLSINQYANTMRGLKQELSDIKRVMQNVDLGSEEYKNLSNRALELTNRLKDLEKDYGTFSRNVGNYQSAFDGLKSVTVTIGGVERQFNSTREASRTLNEELKAMVINGKQDTDEFKEMSSAVQTFNKSLKAAESAVDDLKKSSLTMDMLLDTFQSITAIASVERGFKAIFGFDDAEIEKSIQKLVALQNILQGIEKLRQQMISGDGLVGIIGKGSKAIDEFTASLIKTSTAEQGVAAASTAASTGIKFLNMALKGLGIGAIVGAIMVLVPLFEKVADKIKFWIKGNSDLTSSEKEVESAVESVNEKLREQLDLNEKLKGSGGYTQAKKDAMDQKAYAQAIAESNRLLNEQLRIQAKEKNQQTSSLIKGYGAGNSMFDSGYNSTGAFKGFERQAKSVEELTQWYQKLSKAVRENTGLVIEDANGLVVFEQSATKTRDALVDMEQQMGGAMIKTIQGFNTATKQGQQALADYVNKIMTSGNQMMKSVLLRLPQIIGDETPELKKALESMLGLVKDFADKFNSVQLSMDFKAQMKSFIPETEADKVKRNLKEIGDGLAAEVERINNMQITPMAKTRMIQEAQNLAKAAAEGVKQGYKSANVGSAIKKSNDDLLAAEKLLIRSRLDAMEDGLQKTIKLIEKERKERLDEGRKTIKDQTAYAEYELNINKIYDAKILDEKKNFYENLERLRKDYYNSLLQANLENDRLESDIIQKEIEKVFEQNKPNQKQGFGQYFSESSLAANTLGITDKSVEKTKEYLNLLAKEKAILKEIEVLNDAIATKDARSAGAIGFMTTDLEAQLDKVRESIAAMEDDMGNVDKEIAKRLKNIGYIGELEDTYRLRTAIIKKNNQEIIKENEKLYEEQLEQAKKTILEEAQLRKNVIPQQRKDALDRNDELFTQEMENLKQQLEKKEITETEYMGKLAELTVKHGKDINDITETYKKEEELIIKKANLDIENAESENFTKISALYRKGYADVLTEIEDFSGKVLEKVSNLPSYNVFGFIKVKDTRKNIEEAKKLIQKGVDDIVEARVEIEKKYKNGLINQEDYDATIKQYAAVENNFKTLQADVEKTRTEVIEGTIATANQVLSTLAQNAQQIMSAVWDLQDNQYQQFIKNLDEQIDEYEKALDKQEEITQKHADKVNDIEDELSSARGDRRQELIDQLNEQIRAQRASFAEEKRLEKEKERLEEEKNEAETKQLKKQQQRDIITATINAAVATSNALATKPWQLGVVLAAVAAAAGAVQVAMIKRQKYAKGGLLEGPSHAQGGIKVGGGIEVEGGEYVTNKRTTSKNLELLSYINSKKKELSLSDFEDYFGKDGSKRISIPRTKFADGGQIPTMRTDTGSNGLLNEFREYSERPVVVQVTDIINETDNLRKVKVLAGAE